MAPELIGEDHRELPADMDFLLYKCLGSQIESDIIDTNLRCQLENTADCG